LIPFVDVVNRLYVKIEINHPNMPLNVKASLVVKRYLLARD
jgi:hypothetical protein